MRWTVANQGTQNLTFDTRIFLQTCHNCYVGGTTWFSWNGGTVNNRQQGTWTHSAVIPVNWVACNTYNWVFHTVDSAGVHAESRESDNTTHHALTLYRVC